MLRTGIRIRSGACALSRQDVDPGEGCQEFMGAVCYQRFGCPDLGVPASRFELLSRTLGPWAVDGSFVSYKGIEGGYEELWISGVGSAEEPGIVQRHDQGVSHPHEVSKMLTFPFRPRLVCSWPLHLRSS